MSERIAAHFGSAPVPASAMAIRRERVALYSWANAADELVRGMMPTD